MKKYIQIIRTGLFLIVLAVLLQFKAHAYCVVPSDTVWPGDANGDGNVNEHDILYIGVAWGAKGPVRDSANNTWQADSSKSWSKSFKNGLNYNAANCNGDTAVNIFDTVAVYNNFGRIHHGKALDTTFLSRTPSLTMTVSKHTAKPKDTVQISIYTGDSVRPVDSIYGISFQLSLDTTYVKSCSIAFDPSWLNSSIIQKIQFSKDALKTEGVFGVACTGVTHTNIIPIKGDSSNLLCVMDVVIVDNLSGGFAYINPKIKNLQGLTAHENRLKFKLNDTANIVINTATRDISAHKNLLMQRVSADQVRFISDYTIATVQIINILGQSIQVYNPHQKTALFNSQGLPTGVYAVELIFEDGSRITKPLVINAK